MASLKLNHIYKIYSGNVTAVSDFCLDIEDKEFIVLVGPSGCGKSTTLRMIAGLEEITEGELYIGDRLVNDVAPKDRDIAMVFQNYALYPHMTVYDNMAFGLKLRKKPEGRNRQAALSEAAQHSGHRAVCSTESRRRCPAVSVSALRSAAQSSVSPKVFLLDEPLSNLDAKLRVQMRTEITKLHQRLQHDLHLRYPRPDRGYDHGHAHRRHEGRLHPAGRYPAAPLRLPGEPVCRLGFIGSPQMNFFDAKLVKRNDGVWAEFGSNAIKVPDSKVRKLVDESYIGKDVIMGIRPENIHDEERFLSVADGNLVETKVDVVELMGSETYLYLKVDGKESNIVARVDPRSASRTGDTVKVAFETNRLHFFDKDSELSILNR